MWGGEILVPRLVFYTFLAGYVLFAFLLRKAK